MASSPSAASPSRRRSEWAPNSAARPSRSSGWSSTTSTPIGAGDSVMVASTPGPAPTRWAAVIQGTGGNRQRDFSAQPGAGPQPQLRAEALRALTHALQAPMAMPGIFVGDADAIVAHVQQEAPRA